MNIRKKPVVSHGADRLELIKAAKLYENFTGEPGEVIAKVSPPKCPKVLAVIGEIDGIMYDTFRDGKLEKYVHRFNKKSRPLFCVSPDGKQIFLIGGEYHFTERGVIDKAT